MTDDTRHDRTVRLLAARLEAIAAAAERPGVRSRHVEPGVLRMSVATTNAVRLSLLTAEEAETIWQQADERHPAAGLNRLRATAA